MEAVPRQTARSTVRLWVFLSFSDSLVPRTCSLLIVTLLSKGGAEYGVKQRPIEGYCKRASQGRESAAASFMYTVSRSPSSLYYYDYSRSRSPLPPERYEEWEGGGGTGVENPSSGRAVTQRQGPGRATVSESHVVVDLACSPVVCLTQRQSGAHHVRAISVSASSS